MRAMARGKVPHEDCLVPLGRSVNALAGALGVPATRIHAIVQGRRSVTAARLARYFGCDAISWLALQAGHDLETLTTRKEIERNVPARE